VKAKASGPMSWEDKKKLTEEALAAGREKNVNAFLMDQKESQFGLSILEIDRLPGMFRNLGFTPNDKVAILVNPDSIGSGILRFFENVFYLSSLQIRIFSETEEAKSWLKEKI
jgi:hypothetical protein